MRKNNGGKDNVPDDGRNSDCQYALVREHDAYACDGLTLSYPFSKLTQTFDRMTRCRPKPFRFWPALIFYTF